MTDKQLTTAGILVLVSLGLASIIIFASYFSSVTEGDNNATYLKGKKAGIVESICANENGQYDAYIRTYFPLQRDPLVVAKEKCEMCKKGPRR